VLLNIYINIYIVRGTYIYCSWKEHIYMYIVDGRNFCVGNMSNYSTLICIFKSMLRFSFCNWIAEPPGNSKKSLLDIPEFVLVGAGADIL